MKPVSVGVISDTHIKSLDDFPDFLDAFIKNVDIVLHLGDFTAPDIFDYFHNLPHFHGIAGNHDPRYIKSRLHRWDVVEINGKRLGLNHGYWSPFFSRQRTIARFKREKVDAILCGHTHLLQNETVNDTLMFNPGSMTGYWPAPWKTYGILHIGDSIKGEIVSLEPHDCVGIERYLNQVVTREKFLKTVRLARAIPDYVL